MKHRDFPNKLELLIGALIVGLVAIGLGHNADAQTACPVAPAAPIARDAVKLAWVAPTTTTEGGAIVGAITYTVYELVGSTWTARCTTGAVSAGQLGLAVGTHTYAVTAKTPTQGESARSNSASKDILPPVLNAPTSFTVEGTLQVTGTLTLTPAP